MVVLASTLREPLLQAGGPARLHDRQHHVWLPEPEGASGHHAAFLTEPRSSSLFWVFFLSLFQSSVEGLEHWCRLYCVLSAGVLSCYFTPEEIEAKVPPTLRVAIDKVWTASKSHTMVEWLNPSLGAFSIK